MSAARFRSPKESKMLKYPANGSISGHLHKRFRENSSHFTVHFSNNKWSIPRASRLGIRNLPRKQRVTINRETMAIRLLNNEYTSQKRIKRLTSRLSKQICLINRAA
jgi:hypothetical protein